MDSLLKEKKVIVCAGSGGVGKTTLSAALGVRAAQIGLKVLVLTVDPARRLATALGLEAMGADDVRVPSQDYKGEFFAARVDPKSTFDEFVKATAPNQEVIDKLFANPLYTQMATTLGGSQEFTSLERLYQALRSGKYDLVILDTPPAGHAIEFIDSAEKMERLFQESILKWFMVPIEKQSKITQLLNKGSQVALKAFEVLAGSAFLKHLADLLSAIYTVRNPLLERLKEIRNLLTGSDASFVLVTGFDVEKIGEARDFREQLLERDLRLSHVIVNKAFPSWFVDETKSEVSSDEEKALFGYYEQLRRFYSTHQKAFDQFEKDVGKSVGFVRIEDFDSEVYDLKSLEMVAKELMEAAQESEGEKALNA